MASIIFENWQFSHETRRFGLFFKIGPVSCNKEWLPNFIIFNLFNNLNSFIWNFVNWHLKIGTNMAVFRNYCRLDFIVFRSLVKDTTSFCLAIFWLFLIGIYFSGLIQPNDTSFKWIFHNLLTRSVILFLLEACETLFTATNGIPTS